MKANDFQTRVCKSKIPYPTAQAARRARAHIGHGKYVHVYHCRVCNKYHLAGGGPDGDDRRRRR